MRQLAASFSVAILSMSAWLFATSAAPANAGTITTNCHKETVVFKGPSGEVYQIAKQVCTDVDTDTPSGTSSTSNDCQVAGFTDDKGDPYQMVVDCSNADGWFYNNCRYKLDSSPPAPPVGATTGAWYVKQCYQKHSMWSENPNYVALTPNGTEWRTTAPPGMPIDTGKTMVLDAISKTAFDTPEGYRSPAIAETQRSTVINAHTWFWTDPLTPIDKIVSADGKPTRTPGIAWVQIAAIPTFTVDPGDGTSTITCPDTGHAPRPTDDLFKVASTCEHIYRKTSINANNQQFTATYTLRWTISYTAWDTPNPTPLTTILRPVTDTFPVTEIQTIIVPMPTGR